MRCRMRAQVMRINSANYTAWELRWRCLRALPEARTAEDEPAFLERMLALNPKNYQLWNYRRRFAFHRGLRTPRRCAAAEPC